MKNIYIITFLLFVIHPFVKSQQITPYEKETIESINIFRESTISFGIEKIDTFQNIDGQIVAKKIFKPIGTGICLYVTIQNEIVPCLITAKHVLYDRPTSWIPETVNIRFREADTLEIDSFFGTPIPLYNKSVRNWYPHPDSTVDLACIPLDPYFNWPLKQWPILPYSLFASDEDYFEGKEIFVLGYPSAIGIDLLNKAFLRKGIIAWVPKNLSISKKKILIDCSIFPGNSGGPVFSVSHNYGQILSDTIFQKPRFYGIVSQRRFSENKIVSQNGSLLDGKGAIIYSLESTAVGVIVTAKKVRELLEYVKKDIEKIQSK